MSHTFKNLSNDWWTAPGEDENGMTVLVTGRRGLDAVRRTGLFRYRIEMTWNYDGDAQGLPRYDDSRLMEQATDALHAAFDRPETAVLAGIYTGAGERNWVLYCRDLEQFRRRLNTALGTLDAVLPLEFLCVEDPEWEEYDILCEMEIAPDDE